MKGRSRRQPYEAAGLESVPKYLNGMYRPSAEAYDVKLRDERCGVADAVLIGPRIARLLMDVRQLLQSNALDALQLLIRNPSVNPNLAPEEGCSEAAIAEEARHWLVAHGVRAWTDEVAPGRLNCVGAVGKDDGRTLVFCAHLDTVGTAGMTIAPFEPRLEDGRVYGRGSYDMKGSAAAIMAAAVALAQESFNGRVLVSLVADEEYASLGAQDFVKRYPADACVLTEPSEGAGSLVLAHKGFVWAEIETRGRAAHGSRWDLGVSAIGKMGRVIAALEQFDREELRRRVHPLVGPASLHCATIRGGTGLSTYSENCVMHVERRTLPGETPEQVLRELADVVRSAGEVAEIRCTLHRPPLACDRDAPIASCVREAITRVTGRPPEEIGVGYWMDAALFAAAGIPTVNYGPSGAGAHEPVEWVDLASVIKCSEVLIDVARRFCGQAAGSD
ncbi:MAG TPA: M20/M25/M40 family metallo-hydrolase [Terriglobia bacterium]|nr:M20/M25/M40 family metallo-hydrolase [Terriglobia bacterium]